MLYDWKRFWCPRNGTMAMDGGYLTDPESELFKYAKSDVITFDRISSRHCLVLLGEPGIGKTTAVISEFERVKASGERAVLFEIGPYREERLLREVLRGPDLSDWQQHDYILHCFIDGLDECGLQTKEVGKLIASELVKYKQHLGRLYLRIACRTAEWPATLAQIIPQLWGEEDRGVYELAYLTQRDVKVAATANNVDVDGFVTEVERSECVAMAITPITLDFLLKTYKAQGSLPPSKTELYKAGCIYLCDEHNPSHRDITAPSQSPQQKFEVVSKIAATVILCNRPLLYNGPTHIPREEEISTADLAQNLNVKCTDIDEVVATALFSGRDASTLGFAHQTYAEFLTATFLHTSDWSLARLQGLIYGGLYPQKMVIPQLGETAAWLASMRHDVLLDIAANDPQVLLRSDAASLSPQDKALIVGCILSMLDSGQISTRDWDLRRRYRKLDYPGLAGLLRGYVLNSQFKLHTRCEAVRIAWDCRCIELQGVLIDILLDESADINLRDVISYTICDIGNDVSKEKLLPLITHQQDSDSLDTLKGNALRAMWPDLIDAETVFRHLTLPRKPNYSGSYSEFIRTSLVQNLKPKDVQWALEWLRSHAAELQSRYEVRRFADDIVLLAWRYADREDVQSGLLALYSRLFAHHHCLVHDQDLVTQLDQVIRYSGARLRIVEKMVETSDYSPDTAYGVVFQAPRLLTQDDIPWLIARFRQSASPETGRRWAQVLSYLWRWDTPCYTNEILQAVLDSEMLRKELGLEPIALDSDRARQLREYYHEARSYEKGKAGEKAKKLLDPPPAERVKLAISDIEQGNMWAWYGICEDITLDPDSVRYDHTRLLEFDITTQPVWLELAHVDRLRIINAAEVFLQNKACDPLKWVRKPASWAIVDTDPIKAFVLLMQMAPDKYHALSARVWQKWTPTILGFPAHDEAERALAAELAARAYQHSPEGFTFTLEVLMDAENLSGAGAVSVYERLIAFLDRSLCDAILGKIRQPYFGSGQFNTHRNILETLIDHDHTPAVEYARSLLDFPMPSEQERRTKMLDGAMALMDKVCDAGWDAIWPKIQSEHDFGCALFLALAHRDPFRHAANLVAQLSTNAVADLYIWLAQQFPHAEDPQHDGAYSPSDRDHVAEFRESLLRFLENSGTPTACEAIARIVVALPHLEWLKAVIVEARKNCLQKTWTPLKPDHLKKLVSDAHARFIVSESQLLDLVIETLGRLEKELHDELSPIEGYWDNRKHRNNSRFFPKDEPTISNLIANYLRREVADKRLIVNRECQIRRGQETDIRIDAHPRLSLTVEVKGCWHRELLTAMQSQLVDRYLTGSASPLGLYLVGWFNCATWSDDDGRKRDVPPVTLAELRKQLADQAVRIGSDSDIPGLCLKALVLDFTLSARQSASSPRTRKN